MIINLKCFGKDIKDTRLKLNVDIYKYIILSKNLIFLPLGYILMIETNSSSIFFCFYWTTRRRDEKSNFNVKWVISTYTFINQVRKLVIVCVIDLLSAFLANAELRITNATSEEKIFKLPMANFHIHTMYIYNTHQII